MSYVPALPFGGFAGWRFLERTLERQEASFARSPAGLRDENYFRANIAKITSAADLVADRKLLRVALSAYGLSDDLPNRAFIEKVLDSNTLDRGSFVNRLADKRYAELSKAFGFGDILGPQTARPSVINGILQRSREMRFEEALGTQDPQMRLALSLQRDLRSLAGQASTDETKWLTVLGTPSLRTVFETAYMLPREFSGIDLDRQVAVLRDRTARMTGESGITQFTDPQRMDQLIRRFFVGAQLSELQTLAPGSAALTLLQSMPSVRQLARRP